MMLSAASWKAGTYKLEELREKQKTFGTIVLECDLDLPPETAYKAYNSRWEIEIVMRFYKSACEFDETRVQDDHSIIGSEFCDFLSPSKTPEMGAAVRLRPFSAQWVIILPGRR